jgi:hypothetical protein
MHSPLQKRALAISRCVACFFSQRSHCHLSDTQTTARTCRYGRISGPPSEQLLASAELRARPLARTRTGRPQRTQRRPKQPRLHRDTKSEQRSAYDKQADQHRPRPGSDAGGVAEVPIDEAMEPLQLSHPPVLGHLAYVRNGWQVEVRSTAKRRQSFDQRRCPPERVSR